jgi:hypothetical protein
MDSQVKTYSVLSYLLDQKSRSKPFYLEQTGKEYHLLTDGDMVLLLTYNRYENEYEISTMNLIGYWVGISLDELLATSSSPNYDLIWRHLKYFGITPDQIYNLYSNDTFSYSPRYQIEEPDFDE